TPARFYCRERRKCRRRPRNYGQDYDRPIASRGFSHHHRRPRLDQKDILSFIDTEPRLLRPANYPPGAPGNGSIVLETAKGKVGVINVQCRTFMQPILDNPFRAIEETVARIREETPNIIVDVHGETTSEKIAMGRFLDGKVSAVIGTHTHV